MPPQQSPGYAASPLGSFPELSQMYATNFSSPISNASVQVQYAQDQTSVENAKRAASEAQARAAAFSDAKNYTIITTDGGGLKFYGPDGHQVTAAQYANNTGQKLTDVLKDSQDPIDIRYIQDQKNLTSYLQAKAQSKFDPKQSKIAQDIQNQVQQSYGINLAQQNPTKLIQLMQSNYPTIYGGHKAGFSGPSQSIPTAQNLYQQAGGESAYSAGVKLNQGQSGSGIGL